MGGGVLLASPAGIGIAPEPPRGLGIATTSIARPAAFNSWTRNDCAIEERNDAHSLALEYFPQCRG